MNDQTAQDTQQQNTSYVDDYVPPTDDSNLSDVPLDDTNQDMASQEPTTNEQAADLNEEQDDDNNLDDTLEGDYSPGNDISEEDIEAQNIFFMLGVEAGDEDLKEKFLDQLQDVIWDDFLSNDVKLLLNQDELAQFNTKKSKADSTSGDAQEAAKDEMVEYLESLIPDLEDIMLEKALDLKADLFVERISGMKDYFAEKSDKLSLVEKAEQLMFEDKWKSAAETLNDIEE